MQLKPALRALVRPFPSLPITALLSDGAQRTVWWASTHERDLWLAAVLTAVADIVLTVHGLQLGLRELSPLVNRGLELTGIPVLGILKALALALGVCCTQILPDRHTGVVPLGLLVPTFLAVAINTTLLGFVYLHLLF